VGFGLPTKYAWYANRHYRGVERAIQFSAYYTELNTKRFNEITGVNPTQRDKILDYIESARRNCET
jgi:hypothetical protein